MATLEQAGVPVGPVPTDERHPRAKGFRDGFLAAAALVAIGLAAGWLIVPGGSGNPGSRSATASGGAASSPGASGVTAGLADCEAPDSSRVPSVALTIDTVAGPAGLLVGGSLAAASPTPAIAPSAPAAAPSAPAPPEVAIESGALVGFSLPARICPSSWQVSFAGQPVAVAGDAASGGSGTSGTTGIVFPLAAPVERDGQLLARLAFGPADEVVAWHVVLSPPPIQPLTVVWIPSHGLAQGTGMRPGCTFSFDLGAERGGLFWRTCQGPEGPTGPLGTLHADPGAAVSIENSTFRPSTQAGSPAVACGSLTAAQAFVADPSCRVAYEAGANGEFTFRLPAARVRRVIAVRGCVQALAAACGAWYATVDTLEPAP